MAWSWWDRESVSLWVARRVEADEHPQADKGDNSQMAPVQALHLHFCGIHIAKTNPKFQIITQHFCMSRSEEMHQCLLYDSSEKNAKLLGVEYIISDRLVPRVARRREEILAPAHLRGAGRRPDRPEHEARGRADVHEGPPDHLGQDLAHLARSADRRSHWASRS